VKAPEGLTPYARAAWRRAVAALGDEAEHRRVPLERYARAVDLCERLRAEWTGLGQPLLLHGIRGGVRAHPLVSSMRMAARAEAMAEAAAGLGPARRPVGRPPGAASAPDRLRRVR